jgi:hypothetical protein
MGTIGRRIVGATLAALLLGVAGGRAAAQPATTQGETTDGCGQPIRDPFSRWIVEQGIIEVAGGQRRGGPECPSSGQPISDPVSAAYVAVCFVEVPGAEVPCP